MEAKEWIAIIGVVPVVLSPVITWLSNHSELQKEGARIDYLNKRFDLILRLNQMKTELKDERLSEMLDSELEMCKSQMASHQHNVNVQEKVIGSKPKSWIGKFFLFGPSRTIAQRIFKGLFYFFFTAVIFGLLSLLFITNELPKEEKGYAVMGFLIYLLIALGFRAMAKHDLK